MPVSRREFMQQSAVLTAAGSLSGRQGRSRTVDDAALLSELPPGRPGDDYRPVVTPDGSTLPFKIVDGVKVFHLVAEPVTHEFVPGLVGECWGYNGRVHGPTIEVVEGDRIRVYVTNGLPAATSVHWHGLFVPSGMDGVAGLTQRAIEPGQTFKYEFQLAQHGTFMYHSHHDEMVQLGLGLMGMLVVHPRRPAGPLPDRDYVYLLSEWAIVPGTRRPNPIEMTDFNVFTMNARVFPGTTPIVATKNERVRVRIGNLSAQNHHPIHLHGHRFWVTETDGGAIPEAARWPETSILVPVGTTRTIEFLADNPGDWAFHCHMTHHMMNQMGHDVPNLIGVDTAILDDKIASVLPGYLSVRHSGMTHHEHEERSIPPNSIPMFGGSGPFGYITMGGMVTILKVRETAASAADPGWYRHPSGTVAEPATPEDLAADGIRPDEDR